MLTYFDIIRSSDEEIDETTMIYLVQTENEQFALRACSSSDLLAFKSDPLSHSEHYWLLDKTWLPTTTEMTFFENIFIRDVSDELNVKLTTNALTRENVNDYLKINPLYEMIDDLFVFNENVNVINNMRQVKYTLFDQNNHKLRTKRHLAEIRLIANNPMAARDYMGQVLIIFAQVSERRNELIVLREALHRLITTRPNIQSERESMCAELVRIGAAGSRLRGLVELIKCKIEMIVTDVLIIGTIQSKQLTLIHEMLDRFGTETSPRPLFYLIDVQNQARTLLNQVSDILNLAPNHVNLLDDLSIGGSEISTAAAVSVQMMTKKPPSALAHYSYRITILLNTARVYHARVMTSRIAPEAVLVTLNDMTRVGDEIHDIKMDIEIGDVLSMQAENALEQVVSLLTEVLSVRVETSIEPPVQMSITQENSQTELSMDSVQEASSGLFGFFNSLTTYFFSPSQIAPPIRRRTNAESLSDNVDVIEGVSGRKLPF